MRYNLRCKLYPSGDTQYLWSSRKMDTARRPGRRHGKDVERGEVGNLKAAVQKVYDIAKCHVWLWFVTLTFDGSLFDSFDYDICFKELQKFCKALQKRGCKYVFVPEYHESGRIHFHGLVDGPLPVQSAVSVYTGQEMVDKKGRPIYNITCYHSGFSTATKIDDTKAASRYITKYLNKELGAVVPKGRKRYLCSQGLERPEKSYELVPDDCMGAIIERSRYVKVIDSGQFGRWVLTEMDESEVSAADDEVNKIKILSELEATIEREGL